MDELELVRQHFTGPPPSEQVAQRGYQRLEGAMSRGPRPGYRAVWPATRRWRLLAASVPVAAAAALAIILLAVPATRATPQPGSGPAAATAALKAKLTAATDAASGDVVLITNSDSLPSDTTQTWVWPWYPSTGQQVLGHLNEPALTGKDVWFSFKMPAQAAVSAPSPFGTDVSWRICAPVTWTRVNGGTWYTFTEQPEFFKGRCMSGATMPANGSQILSQISAGDWHDAGSAQINGQPAVELTASGQRTPKGTQPSASANGTLITVQLWVNSQTYLPIESDVVVTQPGHTPSRITSTSYTFQPATSASMAKVRPDLSGLTQVAAPQQ